MVFIMWFWRLFYEEIGAKILKLCRTEDTNVAVVETSKVGDIEKLPTYWRALPGHVQK